MARVGGTVGGKTETTVNTDKYGNLIHNKCGIRVKRGKSISFRK